MTAGEEGGVRLSQMEGALFVETTDDGIAVGSTFVGVRVHEEEEGAEGKEEDEEEEEAKTGTEEEEEEEEEGGLLSLLCGDSSTFCFSGGQHVGHLQEFLQR